MIDSGGKVEKFRLFPRIWALPSFWVMEIEICEKKEE